MITTSGRNNIKRFFAGEIGAIAGSLAFGVGSTPAALSDVALNYEVVRVPLSAIASDGATNKIILKCILPAAILAKIYEVGVFATPPAPERSRAINFIDPGTSQWASGTLTASNARAGAQTVRLDYVANGTTTAELTDIAEDLSEFTDADEIAVGFNASSSNVSVLRLRFGTNASNYFEVSIPTPAQGYNVARIEKSAATVTGTPDWSNITYFALRVTGTAAGGGSVYFDGLRFEQDTNVDSLLVARTVPVTPIDVDADVENEVEYELELTFT